MPHTLLLADDSVTIQRVIELTFADEDVQVVAVSDGDQAIQRLESAPPDIVLADIGMPGKNGYEVAQYIKQSPHLAHIPVVLLTGAFEPVDQARAAQAGCDGVLAKPFEPQLVIGRVKELLAKGRSVDPARDASEPPSVAEAQWAAPMGDAFEKAAPATQVAPAPAEIVDYFDRLDAAFSTLSSGAAAAPVAQPTEPPPAESPATSVVDELDWFDSQINTPAPAVEQWELSGPATTETTELPLSYESPQSAFDSAAMLAPPTESSIPVTPAAAMPAPLAPLAAAPAPPAAAALVLKQVAELPPLADAFAALLAAEQNEPLPSTPPTWPASGPSTEAVVEQVARRVLDQLSDRVARDTVADLVSQIAERLIREEIERIKASIK